MFVQGFNVLFPNNAHLFSVTYTVDVQYCCIYSNAQYSNIGSQLALNGSTMHIAMLIGSDRAVNLALLLEVIRTMFFSA